ncbi:MAG: four helix bundle protein [Bacteroidetes bacterium]|nr:four helix bundle protein [Bacteroidota bacterium]|tara:strand:+ start:373 stop:762 length:390 start_codon:yes stop_codon:yes gene_type:complete
MRKTIEKRLIRFSVSIINFCKHLENDFASQHFSHQIIRSSSSSALNYGEAQGATSKKDFIHKTSIVLKELRETHISLQILEEAKLSNDSRLLAILIKENNELVAIFHKTVITAKENIEHRPSKIENRPI